MYAVQYNQKSSKMQEEALLFKYDTTCQILSGIIETEKGDINGNNTAGTYYMTDGCVYKEWGGTLVQGIFWVGKENQEFYKGQMPDIEIVVGDPDAELKAEAQKVTDQINALGEITLDKEDAVKAARSAYDALDKKAKAYITEETLNVLADAEMKIKDLKPVIGQVTISVERFTIGQGYYKEPVNIALKEGNTCSDIIRSLIGSDNYIGQPNYLSAIKGADLGADKVDVPRLRSSKGWKPIAMPKAWKISMRCAVFYSSF